MSLSSVSRRLKFVTDPQHLVEWIPGSAVPGSHILSVFQASAVISRWTQGSLATVCILVAIQWGRPSLPSLDSSGGEDQSPWEAEAD